MNLSTVHFLALQTLLVTKLESVGINLCNTIQVFCSRHVVVWPELIVWNEAGTVQGSAVWEGFQEELTQRGLTDDGDSKVLELRDIAAQPTAWLVHVQSEENKHIEFV